MAYFNSRDIAAIAVSAALWGTLNSLFSPMIFSLTHLPLFCDLIGFTVLTVAAWWVRKFGAITVIGLVATIINFALSSQAVTFLGFTGAAIVFDLASSSIGYNNFFRKPSSITATAIFISTVSGATAGFIIGSFFMAGPALSVWGGVPGWAGLHAAGGVVGGSLGASLVMALNARKVNPSGETRFP